MEDILNILRPDTLADYFIYGIFLLSLIATAVIPEKNDQASYLMFAVMFCAILDLLRQQGANFPIPGFDNQGFATFLIHVIMAIFPFIAAGAIRRRSRKQGALAVPICLLLGLIGTLYAIGSFLVPQTFYGAV